MTIFSHDAGTIEHRLNGPAYIGGLTPSFSRVARVADTDPSGFRRPKMKTAAPGLHQAHVPGHEGDDRHVGRNGDLRLLALIGHPQHLPLRGRCHPGNGGIGHQAVGREIPGELPLSGSRRQVVDLEGPQLAVTLSNRCRGDIVAGLDVGEATLHHAADGEIRPHAHRDALSRGRPDDQGLPLEPVDGAADARGRCLRGLGKRRENGESAERSHQG